MCISRSVRFSFVTFDHRLFRQIWTADKLNKESDGILNPLQNFQLKLLIDHFGRQFIWITATMRFLFSPENEPMQVGTSFPFLLDMINQSGFRNSHMDQMDCYHPSTRMVAKF